MKIRLTAFALALASLSLVLPAFDASALSTQTVSAANSLPASVLHVATESADVTIVETVPVVLDGDSFTVATAQVDQTSKGTLPSEILIAVPGGYTSDGHTVITSHQPYLELGDNVGVALVKAPSQLLSAAAPTANLEVYTIVGGLDGVATATGEVMSQANAAGDFTLTGAKFGEGPVEFFVNPSNSGVGSSSTVAAVRRGFQLWEDDVDSNLTFTYGGKTTSTGGLSDDRNLASWISTPNPAHTFLAQATWFANSDGEVLGFDIVFNRDYQWSNGNVAGRFDIGTVAAHEAGHALGLGHSGTSRDVMFPSIPSNSIKPLGPGDRAGAASLYPSPVNITAPQSANVLPCGNVTVEWSGPDGGTYAIHAGKTTSTTEYARTSVGTDQSYTLRNLPIDGSDVHVRLYHKVNGSFRLQDTASYTGCAHPIDVSSPTNGTTLPCGNVTVEWSGPDEGTYAVHAGKTTSTTEYARTSVGNDHSYTLRNLPMDGSDVHVRLYHKLNASYVLQDSASFQGCTDPIDLVAPTAASALTCSTATLEWTGPSTGTFAIHAGATPGGKDYAATSTGSNHSLLINTPSDGSNVHVRLWYKPLGGAYQIADEAVYSSCDTPIQVLSPAAGSVLPCGNATIQWSGPSAGTFAIHAGSNPGGKNLAATSTGSDRSRTISVPSDGSDVHITIWYKPVGGPYRVQDMVSFVAC